MSADRWYGPSPMPEKQVTAVSRRPPSNTAPTTPTGVVCRRADLAHPSTLSPVVEGADALFILLTGDILLNGDGLTPHGVLDVARTGGVRRVVLLSSQGAGTRPEAHSHDHLRTFETVRRSDREWTILRPGGFDSNALMWPISSARGG
jgi:uncharacterized protein YbjT (DUF2867 family)